MKATVSEKGQVTIPKALRERLGIKAGQVLDFAEDNGRLVAAKAEKADPIERLYGVLPREPTTDEFIASTRGDPDAT